MNYNTSKYKNFLPISLIIFILATAWTLPKSIKNFDFGNLKNKNYYTTLFSETQRNELAFADEQYLKGKTEFVKAEKLYKKADGYEKIAKSSGKTSSKAKRYTKKGIKKSLKAYKYFFDASDKKFHIYSEKLKNIDNGNSKKHLKAEELGINAREKYLEGIELKNKAKSLSGKNKIAKLKEAFNKHLEAINMQETAFGMFMNDPEIKYNKTNDEAVSNNNQNNEKKLNNNDDEIAKYEPKKDPNIYKSKEEFIVSKLNITVADKGLLEDAHDKRAYAETLMKETDADYTKIENIRKQATNADSEYDRKLKNKMAAGLEDVLFDKMIKAANMFYEADKTKYNVYEKYLPEARNSKNFKEGRKYEENASALHSYAKKIYNKANFYSGHKSNKYIQLMDAVQTELSAIQEQENAFSTYFKQEITPLEKVVEENKPITIKPNKNNDYSKKTKLTYNYNGSYVYSVENPKPKPLIHKKGIIFKIQLGLFKNLLPLEQYGKYSPISYDTYKNNPYKRFMLGEYRSYKTAEYVLNQVITDGLKDPFIVAYEDGERKTATYGMSKIIRNNKFEEIEKQELAKLKNSTNKITEANSTNTEKTNNNSNITDNIDTSSQNTSKINNINSINGLSYSVQLGNFSTKKSITDFKGANPIYYSKNGATYKYMSGAYKTYEEAKNKKNKLTANGYEGLFIIAHNNGTKISLNQAKNLSSNNNSVIKNENNTKKENIYFTVQISAYSHKLNETEMMQYKPITNKYKININKVDGSLYLYTVGKYNTYKKAANVKKDIKNMGFDGFVIAFKNGIRISAQEAIEILKNK